MTEIEALKDLVVHTIPSGEHESLANVDSEELLLQWLTEKLEYLIANNFEGLLFILYRIDVSEARVREMISSTGGAHPARTIAELILERQKQKLYWRNKFKQSPVRTDDDERW